MRDISQPHRCRRLAVSAILTALFVLSLSTSVFAIGRPDILQRAEGWIQARVPYSQSRYAGLEGGLIPTGTPFASSIGWRTDCSGFVSMSLNLTTTVGAPRSLDTASLPKVMVRTTKEELRPGDFMIRPKTLVINGKTVPYGHAVIFVRWIDARHTRYVGYHQSSSGRGAIASEITYPFNSLQGFSPYRYRNIDGERLRRSLLWRGSVTAASVK